jgi:serine/threonine protein kinase
VRLDFLENRVSKNFKETDMINTTIGKYKIIRLIGEGGMAAVYEGEHEMLGTKVAIKVLNPMLSANAQIKERFRNEAKLMASLNHQNITKVIDFDEQPQQLSIIIELLEGEDLNEKIKRNGPLSEKEITDVFSQTLSAFQYAHEKGIVHRDIKPSNIFILPDGRVKILDFGIAKLFGQGNEMTQTGTQMGTPIYMSPEQVKADKSIDHRSDIYSLGVTLFFAINGKTPYNSETDSQFDIFNKIVYEPLPQITGSSKYNNIIKKASEKNREERFQSCNDWISEMNNPSSANSSASSNEDKQTQVKNTTNTRTQVDNLKQETENRLNPSSKTSTNLPQEKKSNKGLIIGIVAVVILILFLIGSSGTDDAQTNEEAAKNGEVDSPPTPIEPPTIIIADTPKKEEATTASDRKPGLLEEAQTNEEEEYPPKKDEEQQRSVEVGLDMHMGAPVDSMP